MRASDLVTQLALLLPQVTDKLTTNVPVASLTRSGTVVTAACSAPHGLEVGAAVSISGAVVPIPITSLTRSGTTGTLVTSTDHDLTSPVAPTVTISGAVEASFNGTFSVIQVRNRRTITFSMADSGPVTATGSPRLEGGESALRQYNSAYAVTEVPNPSTFRFVQAVASLPNPIGTISARTRARVSSTVSPARAVAAYTQQSRDALWLFAVLEDVVASKSREIRSDAVDNIQRGNYFRQQVTQPFSLYLFIPVTDEIGGREARDVAEDLFRQICRAVLHSKFDSGLAAGRQGTVQFVGHGTFDYDPTSVYVHSYSFQQTVDLTFDDTVGPDLDVAFREVVLTQFPDLELGTGLANLVANVDLDDVPL